MSHAIALREPSRTDAWIALGVFLGAVAFQLPFYDTWLAGMDEGHMALYADIVAKGGMFYRDATFYPLPGAFLFLTLLFKTFGASIWVTRVVMTLEFAFFCSLLYLLVRNMGGRGAALSVALTLLAYRVWAFPHWHIYSYSTTALLILLGCAMLLLRFFETGKRWQLLGAGFAFGLGVFCKQDYGAAFLLACGIALVVFTRSTAPEKRPSGLALAVGFIGPAALVGGLSGIWFLWTGVMSDVLQLTIFNHFVGIASYEYATFPSFLPIFQQDPALREPPGLGLYLPGILYTVDAATFFQSSIYRDTAFVDTLVKLYFYGPYLLYAVGLVYLWRNRSRFGEPETRREAFAELMIWGIGSALLLLVTLNRPQDYVHLAVLYWPVFCLLAVYASRWARRRARWIRIAGPIVLLLVFAAPVQYTLRLASLMASTHTTPVASERGGIYLTPSQADVIRNVLEYIAANSTRDDTVAVMPYFPAIHFLANRVGPHRSSYIIWPFPEFPDRDARIVESMERSGTNVLIYHLNFFLDFPRVSEYAPELYDYLVDHFRIDHFFSDQRFGMRMAAARRIPPVTGRPILPADLADLQLEVVDARGVRTPVTDEERDEFVKRDRWPLRRVLALRPSARGGRTAIRIPIEPRPGERLRTAAIIRPDIWGSFRPSWVTFSVRAYSGEHSDLLFEQRIDPQRKLADRKWYEVDVDLGPYVGTEVTLELSTAAQGESGEAFELGGFEEPRLVLAEPAR